MPTGLFRQAAFSFDKIIHPQGVGSEVEAN